MFSFGIRNLENVAVESGILGFESRIQLKESGIPLTIEIQVPQTKNPESSTWNLIQNSWRGI